MHQTLQWDRQSGLGGVDARRTRKVERYDDGPSRRLDGIETLILGTGAADDDRQIELGPDGVGPEEVQDVGRVNDDR